MTPAAIPDPLHSAVAAVGRDLEGLRRRLGDVESGFADLARTVEQLAAGRVAAEPKAPRRLTSWLGLSDGSDVASTERAVVVLTDLVGWVDSIFREFPDAAAVLPECWVCHPEIVEELLWLRQSWAWAYHGPSASAVLVGDWHDRARPGVVRRIRDGAAACAFENHAAAKPSRRTRAASSDTESIRSVATSWTATTAAHAWGGPG